MEKQDPTDQPRSLTETAHARSTDGVSLSSLLAGQAMGLSIKILLYPLLFVPWVVLVLIKLIRKLCT